MDNEENLVYGSTSRYASCINQNLLHIKEQFLHHEWLIFWQTAAVGRIIAFLFTLINKGVQELDGSVVLLREFTNCKALLSSYCTSSNHVLDISCFRWWCWRSAGDWRAGMWLPPSGEEFAADCPWNYKLLTVILTVYSFKGPGSVLVCWRI